jgi:hypothetical protein
MYGINRAEMIKAYISDSYMNPYDYEGYSQEKYANMAKTIRQMRAEARYARQLRAKSKSMHQTKKRQMYQANQPPASPAQPPVSPTQPQSKGGYGKNLALAGLGLTAGGLVLGRALRQRQAKKLLQGKLPWGYIAGGGLAGATGGYVANKYFNQ